MRINSKNPGFTMIELLVVLAILSLMALVAVPRISAFLGNERRESGLLSAFIAATSADAFVNGKTNYLCITISQPDEKNLEIFENKSFDQNSIAVYNLEEMKLVENKHRILDKRTFSSSFIIRSVYLEGAEGISKGFVLIPFYPDGSSEAFTIEISTTGEKNKYFKKSKNSANVKILDEL